MKETKSYDFKNIGQNYIFLRVPDPVPPAAMRSFVMIAKCLQNLANLVEFGGKGGHETLFGTGTH
jgi:hypothetical protein